MKLSILICSLSERTAFLSRLLAILAPQITNEVEVLIDIDNRASTIGAKRNALLQRAKGEYVCFIDDDDEVSSDYVRELFVGINQGVDVICIRGVFTTNGADPHEFIDKPYQEWCATTDNQTYLRGVQHLDAVRRELAVQVAYPEISFAEDRAWNAAFEAAFPNLTFHQVSQPIYFYNYRPNK